MRYTPEVMDYQQGYNCEVLSTILKGASDIMANHLSTKQVMALAGVSHMTVYSWRKGSATREPLPTVDTGSISVAFSPAKLKAWAKKHGIELRHDPVAVADGSVKLKLNAPAKKAAKPPTKRTRTRH